MTKSKKRLFAVAVCPLLVFALLVFAVGILSARATTVARAEALESEGTEIVQSDLDTQAPTFVDRLEEFAAEYTEEIVSAVGCIFTLAYLIVAHIKSRKKFTLFGTDITAVKDDVKNTASLQNDVVNVTNELIAGYNKFEASLNSFQAKEEERYAAFLAAYAYNRAILEVLTTVYANSKNIPQGVKDLVNLKYAEVLKTVGDEEKLKEIAESAEEKESAEESVSTEG